VGEKKKSPYQWQNHHTYQQHVYAYKIQTTTTTTTTIIFGYGKTYFLKEEYLRGYQRMTTLEQHQG